ncbi:MAG: hypothetical protein IJZ53_05610 [Tyzzerella sp.]|nr:hypothetical protein [Tyzzerella sp.]
MFQLEKYKAIPFWSWNDRLEPEILKKQIHWMKENGMGGFFMHARSGLETEYMSKEWMECIEACADEAKELGMKAWVYDENGWPSGFAGGKLLKDETNRDQYITYKIGAFDENATVSYLLAGEVLQRMTIADIEGEYLNLYIHVAASTADILNPEVVEKFINLTHMAYREYFGEKFSEKIEGFFTDEPQYYRWATPYTVMIQQYFKEEFEEDILDSLGLLFVEKEGYRKFRYRYWKGMQTLMLRNFAEKIYTWCEKNNTKLTGHFVQEDSLGLQNMCCGGVMPFYEFEHIPGIDWLGNESYQIGELSPKQVSSAAAQLGKKQVITETFGCCGWDVTPTDLKRIAGFQYANGVNMICHHLIPYTERGSRKYDHPAHYSVVNPWVKEGFCDFNNYFARLGYLLGEGTAHVNVAMLHPIRSTYFDYKRELEESGFGVAKQDELLRKACRELSSRNIEYHFLDETLLAKYGFVEDDKIGCGECKYEYLVLPNILTMDKTTEELLHKFVLNGGKVLIMGDKPSYCEAEKYSYGYLESTCTLAEIVKAQPYCTSNKETLIFSTYRTLNGEQFLYVINVSDKDTYEQTYNFGNEVKSFKREDLLSGERQSVPLSITLKPGEDAILYLSNEQVKSAAEPKVVELCFENAKIDRKDNVLLVDQISYSEDGMNFSKPWPCAALFEKLLKEQYRGRIFFRYEFDVEIIPNQIALRTETSGRDIRAWVNGTLLRKQIATDEFYVQLYDISDMVHSGRNEYVVETDWYENDFVYYALYGENVTESLRNCVKYDSELQPIYIEGEFGVYPQEDYQKSTKQGYVMGENFYIGEKTNFVTDFVIDGYPFVAGEVTLSQKIILDDNNVILQVPGEYQMAEVTVNGDYAGKLLYEKEVDISHVAIQGDNYVEVRFLISNRNLMGPHHCDDGKNDGISPWKFELHNSWTEDKSPYYRNAYELKKFYRE